MTKNEFFQELERYLDDIPYTEYQDIVRDFEEHFHMAYSEGKSDHQVTKELGDPKMVAQSLKPEYTGKMVNIKRTAEIVLSVIGLIIDVITGIFGFLLIYPESNHQIRQRMADAMQAGTSLSSAQINESLDTLGHAGMMLLIASVIGIILAIISIVFLKGNKKPKLGGWLLIIAAVLSFVVSQATFFGAIFLLIGGIIALVRKSKDLEPVAVK
ncbi:hypothetical protein GCM10008983_17400 [Lentibacillus halophilus]|uniref:DUF4064 domain-containing protein n=1 Tax=Lentibacillus halophilus TaxID=295065 RepID=A0ABN0Z9Z9_9BACI